jgi:hypothetical protein
LTAYSSVVVMNPWSGRRSSSPMCYSVLREDVLRAA